MKRNVMMLALWAIVLQGCASTPGIHKAAREGDVKKIYKLMGEGVFPDLPDKWGLRPLHYACYEGHLEAVKALLDKGADPNGLDNRNYRPIHHVCNSDILTLLLERGAKSNVVNELRVTPLHEVLRCQEEKHILVQLLIKSGADLNEKDILGLTPLHIAVGYADQLAVKLLVENGADINMENVQGLTAKDMASVMGKDEIVGILDNNGGQSRKYFSKDETKARFERGKFIGSSGTVPIKKNFEMDSGFAMIKFKLNRDGTDGPSGYYTYRGFETVFGRFFAEPGHTYIIDVHAGIYPQKAYAVAKDKETGQIVGIFK